MEYLLNYLIKKKALHPDTDLKVLRNALLKFKEDNMVYIFTWRHVKERLPKLTKEECKRVIQLEKDSNPHLSILERLGNIYWYYYMKLFVCITDTLKEQVNKVGFTNKELEQYKKKVIEALSELKLNKE